MRVGVKEMSVVAERTMIHPSSTIQFRLEFKIGGCRGKRGGVL